MKPTSGKSVQSQNWIVNLVDRYFRQVKALSTTRIKRQINLTEHKFHFEGHLT
jgi:hypothetical protein